MDINKYLQGQFGRPSRIHCADGFSFSVLATSGAYCTPSGVRGQWSTIEIGYPSAAPTLIMDYVEDYAHPTDTVYAYVPVELVESLIDFHGGQSALGKIGRILRDAMFEITH